MNLLPPALPRAGGQVLPEWFPRTARALPVQQASARAERAKYPGRVSRSHFAGDAACGYCPLQGPFIPAMRLAMRLVLVCGRKHVPVGDDLVDPKASSKREAVLERGKPLCARASSRPPRKARSSDGGER
jgi:hypothetical protein